jgi:hypothetical protein
MQKTLFILTQEADANLQYLQEKIQGLQTISKSELEQIQGLINRCKMVASQGELVLAKVAVKDEPKKESGWDIGFLW